jgi:hypothetical protein
MPQIYQTDNMEVAIRTMVERNDRCVLYINYENPRPIRLRGNDLVDIKGVMVKATLPIANMQIKQWMAQRGLMFYYPSKRVDLVPECDAMFFVEAPNNYHRYAEFAKRVNREVVIYKPPTWALHEELIEKRYPTSYLTSTMLMVAEGLRQRKLCDIHQAALDYSGFDPDETSVFEAGDIMEITGATVSQVNKLFREYGFRGNFVRYDVIAPMAEPDNPHLMEMYKAIESLPSIYNGYRMIPFLRLPGDFYNKMNTLTQLYREGSIRKLPSIYLLQNGYKPSPKYVKDAITVANRAQWFKMRNLIDTAPKYPITPEQVAHLEQIRFEKRAHSLFLGRVFDKSDSTPQE